MRLFEFNEDTDPRLDQLAKQIKNGDMPVIYNASYVADQSIYTMGDLEELGWMTKRYTHDSSGEVDGWIRSYTGPQPVLVKTQGADQLQQLNPGETLE